MSDETTPRRDPSCVAQWPECESGGYDPRCCRFPKSCSCTVYDEPSDDDPELRKPKFEEPDDSPEFRWC